MRDYAELSKSVHCCVDCEESQCEICPRGDTPFSYIECKRKLADDVADAIEELLAAVPKRVSVEERLPKTGKVVLLYINCEKSRPHTGFFTEDGMFMHDVLGDMSRSKWKVTHWMPLPATPKEVERMNLDLTKDLLYKAHEEFIEEASKNRAVKHEQEVKNFRDFAIALRDDARKIKNGNVPFPERVDK